ncbi:MAG: HAD-IIB family hydrolase [bacterium]|nr:HAD-IIB family hydrolase [bacterium]
MRLKQSFRNKKLIVFDMDGTLTPSKEPIRRDMAQLLKKLLERKRIAVIGGGRYEQFRRQFIGKAKFPRELASRLYLFPTSAAAFYRWKNGWREVYARELPAAAKKRIFAAFREVFRKTGYRHPEKVYGRIIEDRGTQVTFSAVGQEAPIPVKERWRRKNDRLRVRLAKLLAKKLPELEVRTGGLTSIDVTRKGLDKAYGIRQMEKILGVRIGDMLFVGDRIFPGGNDYAVVRTGVNYVKVRGPEEAAKVIRFLLAKK